MKKTMKILTVLLLAIMLISLASNVFAAELNPSQLTPTYGDTGDLQDKAGKIMGLIRNVAVIASVYCKYTWLKVIMRGYQGRAL